MPGSAAPEHRAHESAPHAYRAHNALHHHHQHNGRDGDGQNHEHRHSESRLAALTGNPWLQPYVNLEAALVAISGACVGAGILGEVLGWPEAITIALFLTAILAGAVEIVPAGLRGVIQERSLDINFLVTIAVAGAMLLGQWGEGATVVFLFSLGELLEDVTLERTRRSIQALMAMAPETAQVRATGGAERTMPVEQVPVGSTVIVRPGDRIPLDGVVSLGESSVDQAPITGESVPVDRLPGDTVYAGTINGAGYLEVRTTKPFAENTLARIIHLVETAQSEKAPSQRFVERFARVYTPAVVLGAVLVTIVPTLVFDQPLIPWFNRALVLLLVACPCALVVSTPVTVVAAIGNASRNGVLIKGGAYLERAGTLRAVAFDKTGTLTRGVPEIQRVVPLNGKSPEDILTLAAAVEQLSAHPLAEAIVRAARRAGVRRLPAAQGFRSTVGSGVQALVDGQEVLIGRPKWMDAHGVAWHGARSVLEELAGLGQTPIVVAAGPYRGPMQAVGIIAVADEVRPTAKATVEALRRGGVDRIVMLTGDNAATAHAIAAQVGILPQDVKAELLPEGKLEAIQQLVRQHRQVAMVGDGVNDAPALAAATVGIAMGAGGSDTALETADVALVADDLTRLPWVLNLSRRAARTIQVNVAFALATKFIVLALAAAGIANLWLAIAADTGASIAVILNGMRLAGHLPLPAAADRNKLRQRYGLAEEAEHAGHAH
jgi:Zn2+/Cd2+-exporting ATPase